MGMERISEAQLQSVLAQTSTPSVKYLPIGDLKNLGLELGKCTRRYPSQDVTDSAREYLEDYERLAVKYSLQEVIQALQNLRIQGGRQFFPRPDEAAEAIQTMREERAINARHKRFDGSKYEQAKQDAERYREEWKQEMRALAYSHGMTFEELAANKFIPRKAEA